MRPRSRRSTTKGSPTGSRRSRQSLARRSNSPCNCRRKPIAFRRSSPSSMVKSSRGRAQARIELGQPMRESPSTRCTWLDPHAEKAPGASCSRRCVKHMPNGGSGRSSRGSSRRIRPAWRCTSAADFEWWASTSAMGSSKGRGAIASSSNGCCDARDAMIVERGVVAMCAAQACAQIGAFSVAALLPTLISAWSLTNTEAGWISGIYYAAYTVTVPVLSSLADRVDPKRIYLASVALTAVAFAGFAWVATGFCAALVFRALMGMGWAGSYMPGLKALSDCAEGSQLSRAVAAHAAAVGVSGALSFGVAGAVNAWLGWQWTLVPGALGAALAFLLALFGLPARPPRPSIAPRGALLDFRPILRNRSALAYSIAYCVHTWEMSALRGWVVTFLTFVAAHKTGAWTPLAPATVASVMGLLGVWASVWGNELAIRFGRRRFILGTLLTSAVLAAMIGFSAALPYAGAAALVLVYAALIWSDSSSLTAGSAGSAEPGRRGATLAVHSTLGYAGGFAGPLALGATLDLAGGASVLGWGLAFGHVTLAVLAGWVAFVWLRPADLAGDRAPVTAPRIVRSVPGA